MAGGGSVGAPRAGDDEGEGRPAAAGGSQRKKRVGELAVRQLGNQDAGAPVSGGASVSLRHDRSAGGSECGDGERRQAVLRDVLRAEQRDNGDRGGFRFGEDPADDRQVIWDIATAERSGAQGGGR